MVKNVHNLSLFFRKNLLNTFLNKKQELRCNDILGESYNIILYYSKIITETMILVNHFMIQNKNIIILIIHS